MTAPLYLNQTRKQDFSIHILTNKLLNAIDDDTLETLEQYIDEAFRHNVSREFYWMLYRYAREVRQPKSCLYLQQIIQTTYNF